MKYKKKAIMIYIILFFFVFGLIIFMFGIQNGEKIAIQLSRPLGATAWTTSEIQVKLVSYGICMFGGLWILIAHILLVLWIVQNYILEVYKKD